MPRERTEIGQTFSLSSGPPTSLSICTFAADHPERLAEALRFLRPVADEIVVAVAAGSAASEAPDLGELADRCYRVSEVLPADRYVAWLHHACSADWILWLAPDELPSAGLRDG